MKFKEYIDIFDIKETTSMKEWIEKAIPLMEISTAATRYSVEVNYRTTIDQALHSFSKICLGYISAAMKQNGYHVKQVYEEHPLRIMISTRNFDDGEWILIISWNPKHEGGSFIISKGFYNKDRGTISIQSNIKADGDSAADIVNQVKNIMHQFKNLKDRHVEDLKPVPFRSGPK